MSKPSEELSKKRAERVKALIYEYNANNPECKIKNKDVAERIGIDEVAFSGKMNAKRTITDDDAKKIAEIFNVRWQWIQCYDDFPARESEYYQAAEEGFQETNLLSMALLYFGKALGIKMVLNPFDEDINDTIEKMNNGSTEAIDDSVEKLRNGFSFEFDGKKVNFGLDELIDIQYEIRDVVGAILKAFIRRKCE